MIHLVLVLRMPLVHVPRFQKATKARHYVAGSDFLQAHPKRYDGEV